ncbi:MAG TPA: hypothetical protein VHL80_09690, partial [Polyangia bacterium]|nr:hypothetical protein [Polyangia bacterium]
PPPAPPPAAPPPAVATETKPPTATEAMPATRPVVLPPIDVGAWARVGSLFQGAKDPSKLNDWQMNNAYVELHTGGKIHEKVGVTLNLNANMAGYGTSGGGGGVALEDAIISFDLLPELHIWAGHLLVMVDRDNSSGPFFMIPWNYPGLPTFLGGFLPAFGAPHEGPFGRNNGVNVWGDIAGGFATYFAGVYDNGNVASNPLFSGRLRLAFLDKETGFWGNGSYFGDKDILSLDVGGQYQKNGSTGAVPNPMMPMMPTMTLSDYADINVDALLEKKIPGGGWFTADGAFYHYKVPSGGVSNYYYVLAAFASPTVGVGNIQPMVRYQQETVKDGTGTNPWNLDVGLAYLVKGPALRLNATYSYAKLGTNTALGPTGTENALQVSAQAIFF